MSTARFFQQNIGKILMEAGMLCLKVASGFPTENATLSSSTGNSNSTDPIGNVTLSSSTGFNNSTDTLSHDRNERVKTVVIAIGCFFIGIVVCVCAMNTRCTPSDNKQSKKTCW